MRRVLIPADVSPPTAAADHKLYHFSGLSMGTTWSVSIAMGSVTGSAMGGTSGSTTGSAISPQNLQLAIQDQLDAVVAEMSHWEADSNLGRFNRAAAGTWHHLPDDFFGVLAYALTVAEDTSGAYDPTAGEMVNIWGFGPTGRYDSTDYKIPSIANIHAVLGAGDYHRLQLDKVNHRALQAGGMQLDLSSVAKGFGVDKIAHYLAHSGIENYLIEVGGELKGAGMKPDLQPWWVALEPPPQITESDILRPDEIILALHNFAVATSGDYRKFFLMDGKRYPHTIDPRTGFPVSHAVAAVTVVADDCMVADAVSTALTVMGADKGGDFAEQHRIAARFLTRTDEGYREHRSSQFEALLQ